MSDLMVLEWRALGHSLISNEISLVEFKRRARLLEAEPLNALPLFRYGRKNTEVRDERHDSAEINRT